MGIGAGTYNAGGIRALDTEVGVVRSFEHGVFQDEILAMDEGHGFVFCGLYLQVLGAHGETLELRQSSCRNRRCKMS